MTGSQDTMVSSEVEVAVDPDTAFTAFTEELDLWWVRGPINHIAGGRTVAIRRFAETGLRRRWLEYDAARDWLPAHDQAELQQLEHQRAHGQA